MNKRTTSMLRVLLVYLSFILAVALTLGGMGIYALANKQSLAVRVVWLVLSIVLVAIYFCAFPYIKKLAETDIDLEKLKVALYWKFVFEDRICPIHNEHLIPEIEHDAHIGNIKTHNYYCDSCKREYEKEKIQETLEKLAY